MPTAGVERVFASYHHALVEAEDEGLARWLFDAYVPNGLVNGRIVPSRWEKLDGGLGALQRGIDIIWAEKTRGKKLMLTLRNGQAEDEHVAPRMLCSGCAAETARRVSNWKGDMLCSC